MKQEAGILLRDGIYFHQASEFARQNLQYIHWGAHYLCDHPYRVERDYMDSFLFFYILDGSLAFDYRGSHFEAKASHIALLDCKYPNIYYAEQPVSFAWFHFSGGASQLLCDRLYQSLGSVFPSPKGSSARKLFSNILNLLSINSSNDIELSGYIYQLLCQLFYKNSASTEDISLPVRKAAEYMKDNYGNPLFQEEVCAQAGLSLYPFPRLFKKEMKVPPHEYLLNLRLQKAKELLTDTSLSVEEVGLRCGFGSTSHFIRAFQKDTKLTPLKFRKIKL